MKKIVFGIIVASILFSCHDAKEKTIVKKGKVANKASVKEVSQKDETVSYEKFKNELEILLPRSYRTYDGVNPASSLTGNWIDLYEENGAYYLGKANFEIEKGFDDCSGDSLKSIMPKNKTMVFIDDPALKAGKLNSVKINKHKVWPKQKVTYTFNDVNYVFRAEGKVVSQYEITPDDDGENFFKNITNYKLYLKIGNGDEKLLLAEDSFHETFVELLFAGDIDGDGKLDFVFNASRDYEEERMILFISSKAENQDAVKKVSEIAVQFDC